MKNSFLLILLLTFVVTVHAQTKEPEPIDGIAAIVDEDVILMSEVNEAKRAAVIQLQSRTDQLPPDEAITYQVLERLISTKLQVSKARETGIVVSDAEVDKTIRKVAASNNMDINDLRKTLESDGLSFGAFWEQIRDEMTTARLQRKFAEQIAVSKSELDIYLSSDQQSAGEFHLGHILIPVSDSSDSAVVKKSAKQAELVYAELKKGVDFAKAAVTYSGGQKALEGGDLGWRPASQLPPTMVDALKGLKPGDITMPIPGPSGFHILKLIDTREAAKHMVTEYNTQHILIEVNELVSAVDALDQINLIVKQLGEGAEFNELAIKHSDDVSNASKGGDMGWEAPQAFGPQVQKILVELKDGEYSEPFQSSLGWHIMKVTARRESDKTDELVRRQAREAIRSRKSDEELEAFVRRLRSEAYIVDRVSNKQS